MLKTVFGIISLYLLFSLYSCKDSAVNPVDNTSVTFKITKSNNQSHNSLFNHLFPMVYKRGGQELSKTTEFDELRIICLDMTKWKNINEFWEYWINTKQSELYDMKLWDSTKDLWDNYVLLLQRFPGDAFQFIADYGFNVKDSVAKGSIYLNPGVNYFVYGLRKNGVTGFVGEADAYIVKDTTNIINLGYQNQSPDYPFNPYPVGDSVSTNVTLSWECFDPDFDPLKYDVYFGTTSTPQVAQGITSTSFNPGPLSPRTTYYWRIDVSDNNGHFRTGSIWYFTTGD